MISCPKVSSRSARWASGRFTITCSIPSSAWARNAAITSAGVWRPGPEVGLEQRGRLDLGDVPADGLAMAGEDLELVAALAGVGHEDVARVGVLGYEAEGLPLAAAADHDPRPGQRWRHVDGLRESMVAALDRRPVAGEHRPGDPQRLLELLEPLGARRPRQPQPDRFALVPAGSDGEVGRPVAGEHVQRRGRLHQQAGRAKHGVPDHRPEGDALRRLRQEPERRVRLEHRLLRAAEPGVLGQLEEVIHDPQAREAVGLGGLGDLREGRADRRRSTRERERRELEADTHGRVAYAAGSARSQPAASAGTGAGRGRPTRLGEAGGCRRRGLCRCRGSRRGRAQRALLSDLVGDPQQVLGAVLDEVGDGDRVHATGPFSGVRFGIGLLRVRCLSNPWSCGGAG